MSEESERGESGRRPGFGLEMLSDASALSAGEFAYRQLFDAILARRLLPGVRLQEVALAELFDVGRTAVRQALARLEQVGIVESRANRGAQVATPAAESIAGVIDARRVIEGALLERTVRRLRDGILDPAALEPLRLLAREEGEHVGAGRPGVAQRLGCEQHLALADLAAHPALSHPLERLVPQTALAITAHERPAHGYRAWRSRLALFDVVARAEEAPALAALHAHLDALEASIDTSGSPVEDPLASAFAGVASRRGARAGA